MRPSGRMSPEKKVAWAVVCHSLDAGGSPHDRAGTCGVACSGRARHRPPSDLHQERPAFRIVVVLIGLIEKADRAADIAGNKLSHRKMIERLFAAILRGVAAQGECEQAASGPQVPARPAVRRSLSSLGSH
jgi:hypothetical protein